MRRCLAFAAVLTIAVQSLFAGASAEVFEEEIVSSRPAKDTEFQVGDQVLLFSSQDAVGHYTDGTFCRGILVDAATCTAGGTQIHLAAGNYASFWRDGSLKATYVLVEPFEFPIQGKLVPILGEYDIYLPLMFRESGELDYGYLAEETVFTIQGREVACRGQISVHENGVMRLVVPVNDTAFTVQGRDVRFAGERLASFTNEAVLDMGTLVEDTTFDLWGQQITFRSGTPMEFHPNGAVRSGYLRDSTTFTVNATEISVPASTLNPGIFTPTGHPWMFMDGGPDTEVTVRGMAVRFGTSSLEYADLVFRPDGTILRGTLVEETQLETRDGPVTYPPRTVITFDGEGYVETAEELVPYEM